MALASRPSTTVARPDAFNLHWCRVGNAGTPLCTDDFGGILPFPAMAQVAQAKQGARPTMTEAEKPAQPLAPIAGIAGAAR